MSVKIVGFDSLSFSDADIVNPDDCIFAGEPNPHNVRLFLLLDHGFVVCAAFADCLQDAIDECVDEGKMTRFRVEETEAADYGGDIYNCDSLSYVGNAGEPHDLETLGCIELPPPRPSIAAQYGEDVQPLSVHLV